MPKPRYNEINKPVPMHGDPNPQIIFVLPTPDLTASIRGEAGAGEIGHLLKQLIVALKVKWRIAFTYVVNFRLPGQRKSPTAREVRACAPRLADDLARYPEARIVAVGTEAVKAVGINERLSKIDGTWVVNPDGRLVLPVYSPKYLLMDPTKYMVWAQSVVRAFEKQPTILHQSDSEYAIIEENQLDAFFDSLAPQGGPVAVDLETTDLDFTKGRITCAVITDRAGWCAVLPAAAVYSDTFRRRFTELTQRPDVTIVGHNYKYDQKWLHHLEIPLHSYEDTMLMLYAYSVDGLSIIGDGGSRDFSNEQAKGFSLKLATRKFFGLEDYNYKNVLKSIWKGEKGTFNEWDPDTIPDPIARAKAWEALYKYAATDGDYTLRLYNKLSSMIGDRERNLLHGVLYPAARMLLRAEMHGIRIDMDYLEEFEAELLVEERNLKQQLREAINNPDFNPNYHGDVKAALYYGSPYRLPVQTGKDRKVTSNADALRRLAERFGIEFNAKGDVENPQEEVKALRNEHPELHFLLLLLRYRKVQKFRATYVTAWKRLTSPDGYLRPSFWLHGTVTGRLSSSDPNLQNVPRATTPEGFAIKKMLLPDPGHVMVQIDYSQAELRVLAWLSRDPTMVSAYLNGEDLHTSTAIQVYGQEAWDAADKDLKKEMRTKAKAVNFGIAYGLTSYKLAHDWWDQMTREQKQRTSFEENLKQAEMFLAKYLRMRPGVVKYQRDIIERAKTERVLRTVFNRERRFPWLPEHSDRHMKELENHAMNWPIQGIASDLDLRSATVIDEECEKRGWDAHVLKLVHDSIYFSVDPAILWPFLKLATYVMENLPKKYLGDVIPFKADVEIGMNAAEMYEVDMETGQVLVPHPTDKDKKLRLHFRQWWNHYAKERKAA